jgi:hypothetical protein
VRGEQIGLDLTKPSDNPNGGGRVLFTVVVTRPLQGDAELRIVGGEIDGKVHYEAPKPWIIEPIQ